MTTNFRTPAAATASEYAAALVANLPVDTLATVIACLLSCDDSPELSDREADAGCELFEALCHQSPEAMVIAQSR
jgi:hypothetical protein